MEEAIKKVQSMSNKSLLIVWHNLRDYNPHEYWDMAQNVTMDDWASLVKSEIDKRGI